MTDDINEAHDLLNAIDEAGFTQKERNNDRLRAAARTLLAAPSRRPSFSQRAGG